MTLKRKESTVALTYIIEIELVIYDDVAFAVYIFFPMHVVFGSAVRWHVINNISIYNKMVDLFWYYREQFHDNAT